MVKLLSWNVNGLRAALPRGALATVTRESPDVICLQEVKARADQVGQVLPELPYQYFSSTRRPGHSGTAILSRLAPLWWEEGMGHRVSDDEGRVVTAEFPSLYVVERLRSQQPARSSPPGIPPALGQAVPGVRQRARREEAGGVLRGPERGAPGDRHRPAPGEPDERGFHRPGAEELHAPARRGVHRHLPALHPTSGTATRWWSLASRARERNIGWRIDYVCVSEALRPAASEGVHPGFDHGLRPLPRGGRAGGGACSGRPARASGHRRQDLVLLQHRCRGRFPRGC